MSPLVRSLLALAALLAAADAHGQCATIEIGHKTKYPVPLKLVHVPYPGGQVHIPDGACRVPRNTVGAKIKCCNSSDNPNIPPPTITVDNYVWPTINVRVVDRAGCDCEITQYCSEYYKI
ncbi:uncharacterized protein LOC134790899 isoform X2 [Cydia splendana]|uniref:uncharacterized protein LOC134790899 isoform X2 n=1 Tax=Cydia splendana TaxID=1100963 RepID=UPI0028F48682